MAYDRSRNVMVLFGGDPTGFGHVRGDTWEWDGTAWNLLDTDGPPGRREAAMVYDSARGVVVLFGGGGEDNRVLYGDTWAWDGREWMPVAETGPSPRFGHAMAFDEARGVAVLFGGAGGDSLGMADTWEWDGANWHLVSEQGPEGRFGHEMTYDAARAASVLIGGMPGYGREASGTWEWNGVEWRLATSDGPDGRSGHSLVYDRERHVSVLYGGWRGEDFRDTWYWNGGEWIQARSNSPPAAFDHSMVYSDSQRAIVLQGGFDGHAVTSELWMWQFDVLVKSHPQDQTVLGGEQARFSVVVEGEGRPGFQWRRNGVPLRDGGRVSGSTTDSLLITPALAEDEGRFECVVSAACDEIMSESARLEVVDPRLEVLSSCPNGGMATVSWANASPAGRVALIFAREPGIYTVPPHYPCAGTVLGLGSDMLRIAGVTSAGPGGERAISLSIGPAACEAFLQLLDVSSCITSNVVRIE